MGRRRFLHARYFNLCTSLLRSHGSMRSKAFPVVSARLARHPCVTIDASIWVSGYDPRVLQMARPTQLWDIEKQRGHSYEFDARSHERNFRLQPGANSRDHFSCKTNSSPRGRQRESLRRHGQQSGGCFWVVAVTECREAIRKLHSRCELRKVRSSQGRKNLLLHLSRAGSSVHNACTRFHALPQLPPTRGRLNPCAAHIRQFPGDSFCLPRALPGLDRRCR